MIDWEDKGNRWVAGDWVIRKGYSGRRGGKRREAYSLQRYGDIGNIGVFSTLTEAKAAGEKRAGESASKESVVRKAPKTKSTEPESGRGKSESVLGPITAGMTSDQRRSHDQIRSAEIAVAAARREVEFQQRQASSPEYQESYARMASRFPSLKGRPAPSETIRLKRARESLEDAERTLQDRIKRYGSEVGIQTLKDNADGKSETRPQFTSDGRHNYGPGWVSPQGERWEDIDSETQEWLIKRQTENREKVTARKERSAAFAKLVPQLRDTPGIAFVYTNQLVQLDDGSIVPYDHPTVPQPPSGKSSEPDKAKDAQLTELARRIDNNLTGRRTSFPDFEKQVARGQAVIDGMSEEELRRELPASLQDAVIESRAARAKDKKAGESSKAKPDADLEHFEDLKSGKIYKGHKGPGVGALKTDKPELRDGDGDTVVRERRPRKRDGDVPKSPIPPGKYAAIAAEIVKRSRARKAASKRRTSRRANVGLKSSPTGLPKVKIINR